MDSIQAVYASTSGNVEMTVETIADHWRQKEYEVYLHRSEVISPDIIPHNRLFLFATSTWEHGEINPYFAPILKAISEHDCTGKTAFFVGCGDFRYEPVLFNMGIQKVHDLWQEKGGTAAFHPLKINGDPQLAMSQVIAPWIEESYAHLEPLFNNDGATQ